MAKNRNQPKGTPVSNEENTKAEESSQQQAAADTQQPQDGAAPAADTGAPAAAAADEKAEEISSEDKTVLDSIGDAGAAPAQDPVAAPQTTTAAETLLRPKTGLELMVEDALSNGDSILQQVVDVATAYREAMAPNRSLDDDTIRTHQLALFRVVRDALRSPGYYKQALDILLGFVREDMENNGALNVPFMMRGFDGAALANMPPDNRKLLWSFVTLLTTAAGMSDPKQTYTKVSLTQFKENPSLTQEMRNRLVSYFSS